MTKYHLEVYRCPEWKMWAVAKYDSDGNFVGNGSGESEWFQYKNHAMYFAEKELAEDTSISRIRYFNADGRLKRTLSRIES